jgi:hypothetical protein
MISFISARSDEHVSCEDSSYVKETSEFISGGIFDGCSKGIKSHWASQTYSYIFQKYDNPTCDINIENAWYYLLRVKKIFNLPNEHFQSTCVLFYFKKQTRELFVRVIGDGVFYVTSSGEQKKFDIDQNDLVDYLGDHLDDPVYKMRRFVDNTTVHRFNEVEEFKLCSDGIKRIYLPQFYDDQTDPLSLLLGTPTSKNYLDRMCKILKRKKFVFGDDLSIISYAEDK